MKPTVWSFGLVVAVAAGGAGCGLILGLDEFVDAPPDAGAGGAGVCEPGEGQACYSGPEGTQDIGTCRAGQRPCNADGTGFGDCEGEVTPAVEDCAALGDEDCDGVACSEPLWAKVFGDAAAQHGYAVAVDNEGNVVVVGYFVGTVNFGGDTLVSAGDSDVFVAKFDPAGRHLWSKRFGNAYSQIASALTIDMEGNVVVVGGFFGTLSFGGDDLVGMSLDGFVAKFDSLGHHVWSKRFGGSSSDAIRAVAVSSGGDLVISGEFHDSIDFGAGVLTAVGSADIFVARLTGGAGAGVWSERFGDVSIEEVTSVALDTSDSIYVGGSFRGNVSFGGETFVADYKDAFIAKLDWYGNHVWSKAVGAGSGVTTSVAVDLSGEVVAVGAFSGTINLGGEDLSASTSGPAFVAKFTSSGAHAWSRAFDVIAAGVVTDADRNVILACLATSSVDWGGGPLDGGELDVTLAKLSPAGEHVWSKRFLGDSAHSPSDVAVDGSGSSIVLTGIQAGSVDYGLGPVSSTGGAYDVFLAKFAP